MSNADIGKRECADGLGADRDAARSAIEELRRQLHQMVDQHADNLIARITSGVAHEDMEPFSLPLSAHPSVFKGNKPVSVTLPSGVEIMTPTWKKAVLAILQDCNADAQRHEALMYLRSRVSGQSRMILSDTPDYLDAPLKIDEDLYMEGKFDTESLLRVLTKRILDPVGYDYRGITIQYRYPQQTVEAVPVYGEEPISGMEMRM